MLSMRPIALVVLLGFLTGCAAVNLPDYIKSVQPYTRKMSGDQDRIIEAVKVVLFKEGFEIASQLNPSTYERRPGGEDQSKDILLITKPKKYFKGLYFTSMYLNIFINSAADGAEIEIRYEAHSPVRTGVRNDKLCNNLLDHIEKELANSSQP